ncbi:MAG: hypothetical protein AAFV98_21990 [Chloroflexota bacterium]
MLRTALRFSLLIGFLLWGVLASIAQDDIAPNWCYEGQPWGDGRCNNQPTNADNQHYWECGYWNAKVDTGDITLVALETIDSQCAVGYVAVRWSQDAPLVTETAFSTSEIDDTESTSDDVSFGIAE